MRYCLIFVFVFFSSSVYIAVSQPNLPSSLGCQAAEGGTVRCRGVPLGDVAHAFRILTSTPLMKVNNRNGSGTFGGDIYFRALAADIADCQIPELVSGSLKGPLVVVRIIRSGIGSVYPDTFQEQTTTLRVLDLSDNDLTTIPLAIANLEALRQLVLTNNRIAAVEPSSLFRYVRALRYMDLSGNLLGVASAENVRRSTVGVRSVAMVKEQNADEEGVKLIRFDLRPATNYIKTLNLSRNHLVSVPELLYANISFPNLEILDLGMNKLHSLPVKFKPSETMPKLTMLRINQNKLKMIHQENEPTTGDIDLSENPLRCDCNLAWLLLRNATNATCGTPFALKGVLMSRLTTEDLCPGITSDVMTGHELVSLTTVNDTSVIVTWSVQSPGLKRHKKNDTDLEWRVLYRQLDSDPYALTFSGIRKTADEVEAEAITQTSASNHRLRAIFVDILGNLKPDTDYVICLAAVKGSQFIMQRKRCRHVRTDEVVVTTPVARARTAEANNVLATSGQIQVNVIERRAIMTSIDSTEDSITVMWSVVKSPVRKSRRIRATQDGNVEDLNKARFNTDGFVVSIREFGSFNSHEEKVAEDQKIVPLEEEVAKSYDEHKRSDFQKRINGLRANIAHEVCLRDLTTGSVLQTEDLRQFVPGEKGHHPGEVCKEIITGDHLNGKWPQGATTAIAACVTGAVTSIVVALVCFCWCGGGREPKESKKLKQLNEKPNNIRGSSLTGTTMSVISGGGTNLDSLKTAKRSLTSTISSGSEKIIASIGGQKVNIGEVNDPFKTLPCSSTQGRRRWLLLSPEEEETVEEKDLLRSLSPFHPRYSIPSKNKTADEDERNSDKKSKSSSDSSFPSPNSMWFKTPKLLNRSAPSELGSGDTIKSETGSSRLSGPTEDAIEYV